MAERARCEQHGGNTSTGIGEDQHAGNTNKTAFPGTRRGISVGHAEGSRSRTFRDLGLQLSRATRGWAREGVDPVECPGLLGLPSSVDIGAGVTGIAG
jgi:hypothetical protein